MKRNKPTLFIVLYLNFKSLDIYSFLLLLVVLFTAFFNIIIIIIMMIIIIRFVIIAHLPIALYALCACASVHFSHAKCFTHGGIFALPGERKTMKPNERNRKEVNNNKK